MLDPAHKEELYQSALSESTIEASGIYSEYRLASLKKILGWVPNRTMIPALIFPFRGTSGEFTGFKRVKPQVPRLSKDGKPIKYEQPRGEGSRAYFTPEAIPDLLVPSSRLYITEGEKKALSMSEHIGPTIGLTGVWNWTQKQEEGKDRQLIPDLQSVVWSGREVVIVFDADQEFKPQVEQAQIELARILEQHGATVLIRTLDPIRGFGKGIDDLLYLDYLREEIIECVVTGNLHDAKSLSEQKSRSMSRPGIYFTDAPSGSGKTLSDEVLIRSIDSSTTVLPTHDEAKEKAEFYRSLGADASAYPELSSDNCLNHDEAKAAMGFGLSPALSVCPSCPHREDCTFRAEVTVAEESAHSLGTHSRFQVTGGKAAEGKKLVNIHERAIDCLRPTIRIIRDEHEVFAEASRYVEKALDLADRSYDGQLHTERFREWFASASRHARWVRDWLSGRENSIDRPVACAEPRGVHERIYAALRSVTADRKSHVSQLDRDSLAEMDPTEARAWRRKAANLDQSFKHYVRSIVQVAILGASGKADLVLTVDDGKSARRIIMERETPIDPSQIVWIQDATTTIFSLRHVLQADAKGLSVQHMPIETPDQKQPVWQIITDFGEDKTVKGFKFGITMRTDSELVARFVRSFVASLPPSRLPIGVICHKCHKAAVQAVRGALPDRIERVENFGGRSARGSNAWIDPPEGSRACQSLLVLGTPRPHPTLVAERAAQVRSELLDLKQDWVIRYWSGRDRNGRRVAVPYKGFQNRILDLAYHEIVIAELTQCVGRARVYNAEKGCPVVVVCNEPIGIWDFQYGAKDGLEVIAVPGGGFLVRDPEIMTMHGMLLSRSTLRKIMTEAKAIKVVTSANASIKNPKYPLGWVVQGITKSVISMPWLEVKSDPKTPPETPPE